MVPRDYWTPERIKQNKHRFVKKQVSNDGEESINSPSKFKSKETIASELPREPRETVKMIPLVENDVQELIDEAHATEALLKANYVKPNLRKIADECNDLNESQKEKLYQVLVKHEPLFREPEATTQAHQSPFESNRNPNQGDPNHTPSLSRIAKYSSRR